MHVQQHLPKTIACAIALRNCAAAAGADSFRPFDMHPSIPAMAFASRSGVGGAAAQSGLPGEQCHPKKKKKMQPKLQRKRAQRGGLENAPAFDNRKGLPSAADLAAKIGLRVVPAAAHRPKVARRKEKRANGEGSGPSSPSPLPLPSQPHPQSEVRIEWGRSARRFFWGDGGEGRNPNKAAADRPPPPSSVRPLRNDADFPLFLVRAALPGPALSRALSSLDGTEAAEAAERVEQHELTGGRVRALRRSRVARLDPDGCAAHADLMRDLVAGGGLPPELLGGGCDGLHHSYEDGSVVYYRWGGRDYYDVHHDSYDAMEPPRARQRAYTVLLYLRSPPPGGGGGTEFVCLRPVGDGEGGSNNAGDGVEEDAGIVVVPQPGDALIWPNFDRDGRPCADSVHRALPLASGKGAAKGGIGKIVVNMWFEGRISKRNKNKRQGE